jgi:hypothetical protein
LLRPMRIRNKSASTALVGDMEECMHLSPIPSATVVELWLSWLDLVEQQQAVMVQQHRHFLESLLPSGTIFRDNVVAFRRRQPDKAVIELR